ncbi:formyltetrahydrofolate deformylase [Thermaurantiacus tibetensis]|uniref:formyltetrahydrofolate deformylase n=1 Tax=Thermaurantiacus tibetensis TaxID=2759035 RepID=UPI001F299526|nr:formyltetrahydrofolate deformylase [Thermaurantiacus tibetensis]
MAGAMAAARRILRFTCPDRPGILAEVAPALAADGWDIREARLWGDPETGIFFVRMELAGTADAAPRLPLLLAPFVHSLGLAFTLADQAAKLPVLVAVSKADHCLLDLLHKTRIGQLPIRITGVVSNHPDLRAVTEWHGLPFHHLAVTAETRAAQEAALEALMAETGAELLVLARYMQVLSPGLAARLAGRCINIHHSFLPSFRGARPYQQAHARGVKLIGATAHYVTEALDEGPIIEQDIRRVTHETTAAEMAALGRETEASVLSRAVKWHAEQRIFLDNGRTVVFA